MKHISTSAFTLELRDGGEQTVYLAFHGELDLAVALEARELAERALQDGNDLEVDLSGLEFVDSSGLFTLLKVSEAADTLGRRMTVVGTLHSQVRRVLRLSGLPRLMPGSGT